MCGNVYAKLIKPKKLEISKQISLSLAYSTANRLAFGFGFWNRDEIPNVPRNKQEWATLATIASLREYLASNY